MNPAFTLLELLIVISIIAVLMGILLPSLSNARRTAQSGKCLANLRELSATAGMYMDDAGFPTQPWHLGFYTSWGTVSLISEHVFGGFQTEIPHPVWGSNTDMHVIPTEARPYNSYIAPGVNSGPIGSYICPSETNNSTPNVNNPCEPPILDDQFTASMVNGTSYAINWYWFESPPWNGNTAYYASLTKMSAAGSEMLRLKVGGAAANFVIFMENSMNAYMLDARPPDGSHGESCLQTLGEGWHGKPSTYAMAMLDGHAEYRYIDTRFTRGEGWNIWAEPNTPPGFKVTP